MSLLKEFRAFAMRGNVIDLAVGVIIGAAFGKIVSSLVADIIMPPLFKLTKDDGGNWTISIEDYKELAEALVDHDESGSRAVYAERIHKNLSDYQPEDSSDSSSKSSSKDK